MLESQMKNTPERTVRTPIFYKQEMHGSDFFVSEPGTLGYEQVATGGWLSSASINGDDRSQLTVFAILTFEPYYGFDDCYAMVLLAKRKEGQQWPTFSIIVVTNRAMSDPTNNMKTGTVFKNYIQTIPECNQYGEKL